mmetsp:Transcript_14973/g.42421  ORF Transcript_14973/g.42421 Transcript_14973/m.42421 type:complete len:592 (+) Transcript_14973:321-2096(+)
MRSLQVLQRTLFSRASASLRHCSAILRPASAFATNGGQMDSRSASVRNQPPENTPEYVFFSCSLAGPTRSLVPLSPRLCSLLLPLSSRCCAFCILGALARCLRPPVPPSVKTRAACRPLAARVRGLLLPPPPRPVYRKREGKMSSSPAARFTVRAAAEEEDDTPSEAKAAADPAAAAHPELAREVPMASLQDDVWRIPGQNFVCLSFIYGDQYKTLHCGTTADGKPRYYSGDLIKVRGVFKTRENADRFVEECLQAEDPTQGVLLAPMFSWTLLDDAWYQCDQDEDRQRETAAAVEAMLRGYFENEGIRARQLASRVNRAREDGRLRACPPDAPAGPSLADAPADDAKEPPPVAPVDDEASQFFEEAEAAAAAEVRALAAAQAARDRCVGEARLHEVDPAKLGSATGQAPPQLPLIRLADDTSRIEGQEFAVLSYIASRDYRSPSYPNREYKRPLVKVRGVFGSYEKAEQHLMHKVQPVDPHMDLLIVPCFRWAGLEDDVLEDRGYLTSNESVGAVASILHGYRSNGNDKLSDSPQDRLLAARARAAEALAKGASAQSLPHDLELVAHLVPRDDQGRVLADLAQGGRAAPK